MWLLSLIYFLSRLPFLRHYPVFYDSFEYTEVAQKLNFANFVQLTSSTHQPIHTFYFLTILFFKKMFFFLNTETVLVLISLIFGYLTVIFWHRFAQEYLGPKKAFLCAFLLLIFPYFFVSSTNILYETELLFFQVASLYFLIKGLKRNQIAHVLPAGFLWGVSQSVFIGSLLILPVFGLLFYTIRSRGKGAGNIIRLFNFLAISILTTVLIDLIIFRSSPIIVAKYMSHLFDIVSVKEGLGLLFLRIGRNVFVEGGAVLSLSGFLTLIISLAILLMRRRKIFLGFLVWLLPVFFYMQYWHAGLFGRVAIFLIFPASMILSSVFAGKFARVLLLLFILPTTTYYGFKGLERPPIYHFSSAISNLLKKNPAIVTSNYNRFLYNQSQYPVFVFNGSTENIPVAKKFILENLKSGRKVFIDSQGLKYPYYQFDGDFYHVLSLGKIGQSQAKPVIDQFSLTLCDVEGEKLDVYFCAIGAPENRKKELKITPSKGFWPINSNKSYACDPLTNLYYFLFGKRDPASWRFE